MNGEYMIRHKLRSYIRYPIYTDAVNWFDQLALKLGTGGIIYCYVCGNIGLTRVSDRNLRENCFCINCGSSNRQRQIAYVICKTMTLERNRRVGSLRDLRKFTDLSLYNTESTAALHQSLLGVKNYQFSEYYGPKYKSGDRVNNIIHQDLMSLSYEDSSFNLVISSDVFEHLPDPYKAHKEIHRVLKPKGRHIFTVPFLQSEFLDECRAFIDDSGKQILLKEPIYHGDPLRPEGVLVYRHFSLEMLLELRKIGFRTNLYHLYRPIYGILGTNATVFEAIKD